MLRSGRAAVITWICARLDHLPWNRTQLYYASRYRCLCGRVYNVPRDGGPVTTSGGVEVRFR
jgi:hypothetical protein